MSIILEKAIQYAQNLDIVYTKFIKANDVGKTTHGESRSHQAGFYIGKSFLEDIFETEIEKNINYERFVTIKWQDDFETTSRFKYYGSKNECHLTRLGSNFPFKSDENIGDLLIICKENSDYYRAFIISSDEDIENFFAELNINSTETNKVIDKENQFTSEEQLIKCFHSFINKTTLEFPPTLELSTNSRNCYNSAFKITQHKIKTEPDKYLLNWIGAEFQLFKEFENNRYSNTIKTPFKDVEQLIIFANTILNRRKSRAGKSLEHHLSEIFNNFDLLYSTQAITEGNKKPDFLFPESFAYHSPEFNTDQLTFLAAKTTCKDRWRQILNEADRIKTKHLFTLQQGISSNQLTEMYKSNVCLVVPKPYLKSFPEEFRSRILTLDNFISEVKAKQS